MTTPNALFKPALVLSVGLFSLAIIQNIVATTSEKKSATPTAAVTSLAMSGTQSEAEQTDAIRKKFEAMGLKLHDGKYWQEVK